MLKFTLVTARTTFLSLILAVFFSSITIAADSSLVNLQQQMGDLVFRMSRSIVTVETVQRVYTGALISGGGEAVEKAVSTGIICNAQGYVLVTAEMVIGHNQIAVKFDEEIYPAKLVAVDYHSGLALLSTGRMFGQPVSCAPTQTCAGQMVLSMGHAFGLRASPAFGFCAGSRPNGNQQFGVAMNPESIGGGIFNLSGQLLGISVGTLGSEHQTIEAIPAYKLPGIVEHLIRFGDRLAGYVGMSSVEIEIYPPIELSSKTKLANFSDGLIDRGVIVTEILPNSAAAASGVRVGDLIFAYNDLPLESAFELATQVLHTHPGEIVSLSIIRRNSHFQIDVRVGRRKLAGEGADIVAASMNVTKKFTTDSLKQEVLRLKDKLSELEQCVGRIR